LTCTVVTNLLVVSNMSVGGAELRSVCRYKADSLMTGTSHVVVKLYLVSKMSKVGHQNKVLPTILFFNLALRKIANR